MRVLLKHGAFTDARTVHHRTPLHIACILGEENICKILLDADASVNVQDFEKNTPAHYAAFYRSFQLTTIDDINILKLLLEKNVDLAIKNKKGQTPIDVSNSKTIITLFWNYLKKDNDGSKENKIVPPQSPKKALNKKCLDKIQAKTSQKCYADTKPDTLVSVTPSKP